MARPGLVGCQSVAVDSCAKVTSWDLGVVGEEIGSALLGEGAHSLL